MFILLDFCEGNVIYQNHDRFAWVSFTMSHVAHSAIFTPQPFGLEGYCRHGSGGRVGGRPGGRLPNLLNPYLCNRLTDFLHSKFYGIV